MAESNMYADTVTWNPFKGCRFGCTYCKPSFQAQAKRQKHNCMKCYEFEPHTHYDRLKRIPKGKRVFVCGNGDLAFAPRMFVDMLLTRILEAAREDPEREFYLQSKSPSCFARFVHSLPSQVLVVTTLETNRDAGYLEAVRSTAPLPTARWEAFCRLPHHRRVITVEPVMDFDLHTFAGMIIDAEPETVWIGFNSRPKSVKLPEPSPSKVMKLISLLQAAGITVQGKTMRGIPIKEG